MLLFEFDLRFFCANYASLTARGAGDVNRPKRPGLCITVKKLNFCSQGQNSNLLVIKGARDFEVFLSLRLHQLLSGFVHDYFFAVLVLLYREINKQLTVDFIFDKSHSTFSLN